MIVRFFICNNVYRCVYDGGHRACFFGLKFTKTEPAEVDYIIHRHEVDCYNTTKEEILSQVTRAIFEKKSEYNQEFYVNTIEYYENDPIPRKNIYYEFTKIIIDRVQANIEFHGREVIDIDGWI